MDIAAYSQDKEEGNSMTVHKDNEKRDEKLLHDLQQEQVYSLRKEEIYSPYPSNFIIPKGVCEKNEPVMIINK
ncbi:MAG: hypothetical protein ACK415_11655 [Thermodesulfovibrionales bacterium]